MPLTPQQAAAMKYIVSATLDAIRAAGPSGAPGGVMYAAMMTHGCTLQQFQSLMNALVKAGKVRREGELYFIAEQVPA